ncbi:NAD(P)-binding domain-containing protein [Nonomuraea sp. NPDC050556]|uniref:imine reductase family protein n=1 Tax=Nonomuraea sp. NPDC050556 TaxID=3364369 RepID=UPI00379B352E
MTDVSVIGLGSMGSQLARTLLGAGLQVTVWNRTAGKAPKNATEAATATEAVMASPLVIFCVLDYAAVDALLAEAGEAVQGRTILNLTNGRPVEARRTAEQVGKNGAEYLDGGIMAVPPMIGNPGALILYSGPEKVLDGHRATLEHLAAVRYVGEDPGLAALHDLALLGGMYGMFGGFFQAVAMVGPKGATAFTQELLVPWVTAMIGLLPGLATSIETGDFTSQDANAEVNRASLANILLASKEQGTETDLLAPMLRAFERLVAQGRGADDLSAAIDTI